MEYDYEGEEIEYAYLRRHVSLSTVSKITNEFIIILSTNVFSGSEFESVQREENNCD